MLKIEMEIEEKNIVFIMAASIDQSIPGKRFFEIPENFSNETE